MPTFLYPHLGHLQAYILHGINDNYMLNLHVNGQISVYT